MRKNLYLYLTLACFIGLIAIFIVDGYLGVYDTIYITAGEREEKIETDFWLRQGPVPPGGGKGAFYISANWAEKVFFRYEVDNRQFSQYSADVEVSVWRMREKVLNLVSQPITVAPFDKGVVEWVLDTAELKPDELPPEQGYEFSVIINQGEIERQVILYVNPSPFPKLPAPTR